MQMTWELIFSVIGGGFGWFVGEFRPLLPLIIAINLNKTWNR